MHVPNLLMVLMHELLLRGVVFMCLQRYPFL